MELKKYELGDIAHIEISGVDKKTVEGETPVRLCNFVDVYHNWAITKNLHDSFMLASAKDCEIEKCSIRKGQVAITKDSETRDDIGIPTYIADDFDDVLLGYSPSRFAKQGDILMSVRAPVGALNIANNDCCIGRGLAALNSKIGSTIHLYYILNDLRLTFEQRNAAGTTFGSITKDDLFNLPVVKPQEDIVLRYERLCSPVFDRQMILDSEIVELTKQRDELLPLLMNGQVSVNCDLSHD